MKKITKQLVTLSLVMASLFFSQCKSKNGEKEAVQNEKTQQGTPVRVSPIQKRLITQDIEYASSLVPFQENHIATSTPGRIEKINVEISDRIKKGQLLVQMDPTKLKQAETTLKNLELDFHRLDTLLQTNTIAKQQYDQIKAQYINAKTNVEFLEQNTYLTAPFSGIVTDKKFEDGELFGGSPNTQDGKVAIVSISQIDKLKAFIDVSERYFPVINVGDSLTFESNIYPDKEFKGKVYRIHPTIDETSRTFIVEVLIPNRNEILRPGMFGRVLLSTGKTDSYVVPSSAVLKLQGSNERYVFVNENNKAKRIGVKIGKRFDEFVELISDEIKENDQLIVVGQSKLNDMMAVQVVN